MLRATNARVRSATIALLGVLLASAPARAAAPVVIDDFETLRDWSTVASDGSRISIAQDTGRNGMAMRVDFEVANGGWVILHKDVSLDLPENYAFMFDLRAEAPRSNVEFKLIAPGGKSVWWRRQRDF